MIKILFFGDIVGKIGRKALKLALPELKKKYQPDLIFANGENIAHGSGITPKTIKEVKEAGVDYFTTGNHIYDNPEYQNVFKENLPVLIPANLNNKLNKGWVNLKIKNTNLILINLLGQVFIEDIKEISHPALKLDQILEKEKAKIIIVDFHAEATAEKKLLFYHSIGRVSAVLGTHTHIPTADYQIYQGTAYISDLGMVGLKNSILGFLPEPAVSKYLENKKPKLELANRGLATINGLFLEINKKTGQTKKIKQIIKNVEVK